MDQRVIVPVPADLGKGRESIHLWETKDYHSNSLPSEQHSFLDDSAKLSLLSALEGTAGLAEQQGELRIMHEHAEMEGCAVCANSRHRVPVGPRLPGCALGCKVGPCWISHSLS